MSFNRKIITSFTLASTMFVAGMIAITHSHFDVGGNLGEASIAAACPCAAHQSTNSDSELPTESNQNDSCLICRLIAEIQADLPQFVELNFDSMVGELYLPVESSFYAKPNRIFRGRAPPVC